MKIVKPSKYIIILIIYNQDGGLIHFQHQNINISMININSDKNRANFVIFNNFTFFMKITTLLLWKKKATYSFNNRIKLYLIP